MKGKKLICWLLNETYGPWSMGLFDKHTHTLPFSCSVSSPTRHRLSISVATSFPPGDDRASGTAPPFARFSGYRKGYAHPFSSLRAVLNRTPKPLIYAICIRI
jgi:hypothetical protein